MYYRAVSVGTVCVRTCSRCSHDTAKIPPTVYISQECGLASALSSTASTNHISAQRYTGGVPPSINNQLLREHTAQERLHDPASEYCLKISRHHVQYILYIKTSCGPINTCRLAAERSYMVH